MQIETEKIATFDASDMSVAIVVARFNKETTDALLENAKKMLEAYGVSKIEIISVAGAIEIPFALNRLAKRGHFNALVALGCVIQGDTPHFDYVCKTAQEGVLRVSLDHDVPIGFGILTLTDTSQITGRISLGGEAVAAALDSSQIM